ncbi:hypothetical protein L9F63_008026, partial [Diploptera punctata]
SQKAEEEARSLQKKIQQIENDLDQTMEQLMQVNAKLDEKDKAFQTFDSRFESWKRILSTMFQAPKGNECHMLCDRYAGLTTWLISSSLETCEPEQASAFMNTSKSLAYIQIILVDLELMRITSPPKCYEKVSRAREKKPYDSHGDPRRSSRPVRLSSVGGKHGRVAALTSVTARPSVQDGRDCVLTAERIGIRQQLLANNSQQLQTPNNNVNRTSTLETTRRTKKKSSRHSDNVRTAESSVQQNPSDFSDSDVTSLSVRPAAEGSSQSDQEEAVDPDPETEELARLRCPSECTEVIAEREARRRQRRCADYPGFAFGSSIFGSDTMMKFSVIRNELQNIKNSQLKRDKITVKMTTNMQQGTLLDVLKKKMRQTKEEMEKYKDECEEFHKRLQVEIMRREENQNALFLQMAGELTG